jgi:hypothetical protein
MRLAEIFDIGYFCETVPLAGENTLATVGFKSHADTANPCEKINKFKFIGNKLSFYLLLIVWSSF